MTAPASDNPVGHPKPPRAAAGFMLTLVGIGFFVFLAYKGLLRPLLPVIVIVVAVLILLRIIKAITAPLP